MGKYTGKLYRPLNGTEGMLFEERFCLQCLHCDPNPDGKKQCELILFAMCYDTLDKEYPKEWMYNENDNPTCTKWQKWDWGNDGNPDDPDNPKAPILEDPNQLCMPFIFEEIGIKPTVEEMSSN